MEYGKGIIEVLKEYGIILESELTNTVNKLALEIYENGRKEGIQTGIKTGASWACNELEIKLIDFKNEV